MKKERSYVKIIIAVFIFLVCSLIDIYLNFQDQKLLFYMDWFASDYYGNNIGMLLFCSIIFFSYSLYKLIKEWKYLSSIIRFWLVVTLPLSGFLFLICIKNLFSYFSNT